MFANRRSGDEPSSGNRLDKARERMGPGGFRGLQIRWPRPCGRGGGFDSLSLPPVYTGAEKPLDDVSRGFLFADLSPSPETFLADSKAHIAVAASRILTRNDQKPPIVASRTERLPRFPT